MTDVYYSYEIKDSGGAEVSTSELFSTFQHAEFDLKLSTMQDGHRATFYQIVDQRPDLAFFTVDQIDGERIGNSIQARKGNSDA